jgi:NDP-sugar pyrophosphorylase family protein
MKVVILAAGLGTRLRPLTYKIPKPLVPILGKPFLEYVLNNFIQAGYDDFIIVAHYKIEQINNFVKGYAKENGCKIEVIDQGEPLGTGHAVLAAKKKINENFIVAMSDNLFSKKDLVKFKISDSFCYIGALKHEYPEQYGNILFEKDFLKAIVEKPSKKVSDFINAGIYKFTPEIFSILEKIEKSPRGEYELTDAITQLCAKKKVKIIYLEDYWLDLGKPEDIPKIEAFLSSFS